MERTSDSPAAEAFRRLMAEASANEHARVDALVACSQRNLWVATWEPASFSMRTLEHENGHTALPVFSDEFELDRAAVELEWNRGGFRVGRKEIGARDAMRHVINEQLTFMVIDVASPHCIEASRAEIEPLVRVASRSDSQGPFAAVGRITSTMIEAVRTSTAPSERESSPVAASELVAPASQRNEPITGTFGVPARRERSEPAMPVVAAPSTKREGSEPTIPALAIPPRRESSSPELPSADVASKVSVPPMASLPPAAPGGVVNDLAPVDDALATIVKSSHEPPDAWLDAYSAALKHYPEVEWASFCLIAFGSHDPVPMIAIRVEPALRGRIGEIAASIGNVSASLRIRVGTLVLDRGNLLREARTDGVPFHPWRRRKTGTFTPVQ